MPSYRKYECYEMKENLYFVSGGDYIMTYEVINDVYIPKLAEIYVKTYNAPPWNDEWTISTATKKLDEMINCRNSFGLVCFDDESNIIGIIIGSSETYYNCKQFFIKDFLILPDFQGRGIGSRLMNELEGRLKDMGINKTYLITSRTNKTEKYYHKRGYTSWDGIVVMGKYLND
jgi:GNAT superfamily N-acetyltransferase